MNGAKALFKALTDAGLDTCFANPGTSEMHLVYEIGVTSGVRAVLCLEENTVTGAADGYARMAGKPAFTLLHVGSGFANGIANLHNAGRANSAVINIVGANATYLQPRYAEHELVNGRIADLARVVSHWTREARTPNDLGVFAAEAVHYARQGSGKVCTLVAPTDCQWQPALPAPVAAEPPAAPRVAPEAIESAAALLANGRKTALLVGSYALHGEAIELAGRVAAKTGVDLLGEMWVSRLARGEGSVPVQLVPYLREHAAGMLQAYQQLILVGARVPVSTFAYEGQSIEKVPPGCEMVTLATVDHDLTAALRDLAQAVGAAEQPARRRPRVAASAPTGLLNASAIGQSLNVAMPENAILVNDGATLSLAIIHNTLGARAHDYLDASCGGAIGGGMPLALGAAVACPDRKTILLQGDGSGMYSLQALWSMAREQTDVVTIVLRNDNYAILEVELARVREVDANDKMLSLMHLDQPKIDWVKLAEGQGVRATRATTAEEFHAQFEDAMRTRGPYLIEAQVTDSVQPLVQMIRASR